MPSNPSGDPLSLEYVCGRCGSTAVARDAWVEWSVPDQAWLLSEIFDFAFCHHCHRETRLIERLAPELRR
jgi:hypothetical protein